VSGRAKALTLVVGIFDAGGGRALRRREWQMKHKIFIVSLALIGLAGCKSNPNKAEPIETNLERPNTVTGGEKVGLKNGEMVVLDKVQIAEKLRDVQNQVYALEDRVYGMRKFGSLGLYGELKACRRKLASRQLGGTGSMVWTEPLDRITDKEDDLKIGLDEQKDLVGVSQEYLRDRLSRFQGYKMILQKRNDEFEEKIEECKTDVANKKMDASQSSKVMVTEAPKATIDKSAINQFMCGYVKAGASLESLMVNAFAHGWLSLSDFKMDQNLVGGPVKDVHGDARNNGFLFSGWKMSFDQSLITVGDLLNEGKDAKLVAWAYDHKADVASGGSCLPAAEGAWNN
jgi:hypothetical protein